MSQHPQASEELLQKVGDAMTMLGLVTAKINVDNPVRAPT